MRVNRVSVIVLTSALLALPFAPTADAAYVMPQIGGGQVGMMGAPMKHTDVSFDGVNISLHVDDTVATPALRPLEPPDEFDPSLAWSVLTDRAYNFQYAWNPGGFITLPQGGSIWVERLHHDAGLEVFLRPPAAPAYAPVFAADGDRWMWSGAMQHNAYAVLNPTQSLYTATYRVYIGDITTGQPLDGYGSAEVTWEWTATPVPEPASLAVLISAAAMLVRRQR
ncbi:MAG: hypothetical protein IT441_00355 [Phycisphaeraceae bacterium]|nr:hypothetical protein [Phycisphaeraceae bacterium]